MIIRFRPEGIIMHLKTKQKMKNSPGSLQVGRDANINIKPIQLEVGATIESCTTTEEGAEKVKKQLRECCKSVWTVQNGLNIECFLMLGPSKQKEYGIFCWSDPKGHFWFTVESTYKDFYSKEVKILHTNGQGAKLGTFDDIKEAVERVDDLFYPKPETEQERKVREQSAKEAMQGLLKLLKRIKTIF